MKQIDYVVEIIKDADNLYTMERHLILTRLAAYFGIRNAPKYN